MDILQGICMGGGSDKWDDVVFVSGGGGTRLPMG